MLHWLLLLLLLSVAIGSLVALFLWLLDAVTHLRWAYGWLLWLLPLAGIGIHLLYRLWGKDSERGNNLIIDEIHTPGGGVPARMTPLVFIATIITHLFGGSAGREGTAVQMGGSLAGVLARRFRLHKRATSLLLMAGIAGGFGAVFGTPVAGTIFAVEVLVVGRIHYKALLPCFAAAVLSDQVTAAWGIHHTHYAVAPLAAGSASWAHTPAGIGIGAVLVGMASGLVAALFAGVSHSIKRWSLKLIKTEWLIPVAGALLLWAMVWLCGTTDYLGLGVTGQYRNSLSIVQAFKAGGAGYWSWLWKLVFTAVTLSTGFKGGEVTPLFFIGATLGNALAMLCGAPADVFAALGFIAVFAGATNTPVACTIMGAELFGTTYIAPFALACLTAYYFSGYSGIYTAQRRHHTAAPGKSIRHYFRKGIPGRRW